MLQINDNYIIISSQENIYVYSTNNNMKEFIKINSYDDAYMNRRILLKNNLLIVAYPNNVNNKGELYIYDITNLKLNKFFHNINNDDVYFNFGKDIDFYDNMLFVSSFNTDLNYYFDVKNNVCFLNDNTNDIINNNSITVFTSNNNFIWNVEQIITNPNKNDKLFGQYIYYINDFLVITGDNYLYYTLKMIINLNYQLM